MALFKSHQEDSDRSRLLSVYEKTYSTIPDNEEVDVQKPKIDFVAIDFETANANMVSACSLGLVAVSGTEIVSEEYYLIKPPTDQFDYTNVSIHGLTYQDVKDGPTFDLVWDKIKHYFSDTLVVAHNAHFDMSVLKNLLDLYSLPCPDFIYLDSITISHEAVDYDCGRSLEERAKFFNLNNEHHHNALSDALMAAQICICSLNVLNMKSLTWYAIIKDLKAKQFSEIKPQKKFGKMFPKSKTKISDIVCSNTSVDEHNPLYNKSCVLTGELISLTREEAMQKIVDAGGIVKSSVSRNTDYLIVGGQDISIVGDDGLSSKQERAYQLREEGYTINIINETEFMEIFIRK